MAARVPHLATSWLGWPLVFHPHPRLGLDHRVPFRPWHSAWPLVGGRCLQDIGAPRLRVSSPDKVARHQFRRVSCLWSVTAAPPSQDCLGIRASLTDSSEPLSKVDCGTDLPAPPRDAFTL
eukprot:2346013-Alexandrium_andersonii.AAC.1